MFFLLVLQVNDQKNVHAEYRGVSVKMTFKLLHFECQLQFMKLLFSDSGGNSAFKHNCQIA